jgi:hypothetical protein
MGQTLEKGDRMEHRMAKLEVAHGHVNPRGLSRLPHEVNITRRTMLEKKLHISGDLRPHFLSHGGHGPHGANQLK